MAAAAARRLGSQLLCTRGARARAGRAGSRARVGCRWPAWTRAGRGCCAAGAGKGPQEGRDCWSGATAGLPSTKRRRSLGAQPTKSTHMQSPNTQWRGPIAHCETALGVSPALGAVSSPRRPPRPPPPPAFPLQAGVGPDPRVQPPPQPPGESLSASSQRQQPPPEGCGPADPSQPCWLSVSLECEALVATSTGPGAGPGAGVQLDTLVDWRLVVRPPLSIINMLPVAGGWLGGSCLGSEGAAVE